MTGFSPTDYLLLVRLLLAYVLMRFVVPARTLPMNSPFRAAGLTVFAVLCLNGWTLKNNGVAMLLGVAFWLTQRLKARRALSAQIFFLREGVFQLALLGVWLWLVGGRPDLAAWLDAPRPLILLTGYLIAIFPLGQLISLATQSWREEVQSSDQHSLANAGKWIGIFERILILTFVLLDQYSAIGLLIAAKSILRFNDKGPDDAVQKRTEYILIGTLLSFALALLLGLAMKALLATA